MRIIPESIKEYGMIRSIRKGLHEPVYVLDDYYFLCDAEEAVDEIHLTGKEKMNGYHFDFMNVFDVLQEDDQRVSQGEAPCLFRRDRMLLEQLISEGYLMEMR